MGYAHKAASLEASLLGAWLEVRLCLLQVSTHCLERGHLMGKIWWSEMELFQRVLQAWRTAAQVHLLEKSSIIDDLPTSWRPHMSPVVFNGHTANILKIARFHQMLAQG